MQGCWLRCLSNHSLDFLEYKDSVEEAIKDADIISLRTCKQSFHLFDKEMFAKVKKGAILVNAGGCY